MQSHSDIYRYIQKSGIYSSLWQRPTGKDQYKYPMQRPICKACDQRPCAVNYYRDGVAHYRTRCETCARKGKGIKSRKPRWETAGYKKKPACDKCGFKAKHSSQLLVLHTDGNLNNTELRNLKTVCLNCAADLKRTDSIWRPGDLEPDV